jgi:hypothetical protein
MDADGNLALGAGGRLFAIIDGQLHIVTTSTRGRHRADLDRRGPCHLRRHRSR